MTGYVFSIVITFQIWACHVTCVDKLFKIFYRQVLYYILGKVTKYELDTCTGSRVITIFCGGGGLKGPHSLVE